MIKFFLGSVPFGCDNIGDEAILESTIEILRRNFPHCQICVATAKPTETAKLLNCKACLLRYPPCCLLLSESEISSVGVLDILNILPCYFPYLFARDFLKLILNESVADFPCHG